MSFLSLGHSKFLPNIPKKNIQVYDNTEEKNIIRRCPLLGGGLDDIDRLGIGCPHISERPDDQEDQENCQRGETGRPGAGSSSGGTGLLAAHYSNNYSWNIELFSLNFNSSVYIIPYIPKRVFDKNVNASIERFIIN